MWFTLLALLKRQTRAISSFKKSDPLYFVKKQGIHTKTKERRSNPGPRCLERFGNILNQPTRPGLPANSTPSYIPLQVYSITISKEINKFKSSFKKIQWSTKYCRYSWTALQDCAVGCIFTLLYSTQKPRLGIHSFAHSLFCSKLLILKSDRERFAL